MKTILLIEDNFEMRENTSEILELAGYKVIATENGKIGVDQAIKHLPNLIICDVMMPELDGYGVLYILSKNSKTAGIPFIFLTAKAEKDDFRKGMNLGADDYITKPFDSEVLLHKIRAILKRNEELNRESENPIWQYAEIAFWLVGAARRGRHVRPVSRAAAVLRTVLARRAESSRGNLEKVLGVACQPKLAHERRGIDRL